MESKSERAQASYELILLVAFVVVISVLISSYFMADAEKSRIEAGAKAVLLEELNKSEKFYFIQTVELNSGVLEICLNPSVPAVLECNGIRDAISARVNVPASSIRFGFVPDYGLCSSFAQCS